MDINEIFAMSQKNPIKMKPRQALQADNSSQADDPPPEVALTPTATEPKPSSQDDTQKDNTPAPLLTRQPLWTANLPKPSLPSSLILPLWTSASLARIIALFARPAKLASWRWRCLISTIKYEVSAKTSRAKAPPTKSCWF